MKKESDLSRLMSYAGGHKAFTYASWLLSAVSALMALVPFLYIWMILRDVLACALQNVSFMLPVGLLYFLVKDMMEGTTAGRTAFYVTGCVVCFAFILLATWFQYNGTFFATYKESGVRRLALAERLRKLPLSFFGKRDLADLTSTIMADCEVLEKTCSHYIPGLFGSIISTVLIALSLFAFDWRMALARCG